MIVLCDLDHTICDAAWRDGMIGVCSWDEYHAEAAKDKIIPATRAIVNALVQANNFVYGITSRPGKWREMTAKWMLDNGVMLHDILMRENDDFRQAPAIKLDLARKYCGKPLAEHVDLLIEDRDDVVSAFMAEGVTCVHVRGGSKRL